MAAEVYTLCVCDFMIAFWAKTQKHRRIVEGKLNEVSIFLVLDCILSNDFILAFGAINRAHIA